MNRAEHGHNRRPRRGVRRARLGLRLFGVLLTMGLAGCARAGATATPTRGVPTVSMPARATQPTPRPFAEPSPTPTAAVTPTATAVSTPTRTPTARPTPREHLVDLVPTASIGGHLYCRTGPGIYYPAVRVLQPGEQVELAGANKIFYDWWYVRLEDGTTCWAHRKWVYDVTDDLAPYLPQVTPPPPPPAAFKPIRHQWPLMVPFCPAFFSPALQFQVKNLGPEPIRSFEIILTVLDTGAVYPTRVAEGIPTCGKVRTQIPPGETVAVAAFTRQDLTDKQVRLDLRGCTQPRFQGACVAYSLTWTIEPPPRPAFPWP